MHARVNPSTVLGTALLLGATLLACKGKKNEPPATTTTTPETPATTAPAASAAPEASSKLFKVGDTAKGNDYSLSVTSVKECKPKYYFSKPKKGTVWLGAELVIEATSDKQIWSNASNAKVTDADGLTYNYTFATTKDCDPGLNATQLNKTEKAKGWVVFEVPEKASGLKLVYNPSIVGTPDQVKFELGSLPLGATETAAATSAAPAEAPKAEAPKTAPKAEAPKTAPKSEPPKTTPKAEPPKTAPKAEPPKTEPPKTAPAPTPKATTPAPGF